MDKKTAKQVVPFCSLENGDPLPIVSEMRLLGLIFDSNLSWWPLVVDITRRSSAKIWSLVKLREVGADRDQLVSLYIARVRATVEFAAQVYGTVLNAGQSDAIEKIQRRCCQIILGPQSLSYARNLQTLGLESLEKRRNDLVYQFAISSFRSVEHRWWFTPHPDPPLHTRLSAPRFLVP